MQSIFFNYVYDGKHHPQKKKQNMTWPSGKTSLCKCLPSATCCLPCCDVSSLKLGDEWQKLVASTSRLVSWFKLWKKCIMLVQFTTSFTTCHGVSFSFLVYMDDSLVSWTSFPDQLSVYVPKQDHPLICFNRKLRANVSVFRPTVETKIDPKKKPWWIHILWANI